MGVAHTKRIVKKLLRPESSVRRQAVDIFLRSRKLRPGPRREDLRQLAYGLLRLHRLGVRANVEVRAP
jgi:hypothetical protein